MGDKFEVTDEYGYKRGEFETDRHTNIDRVVLKNEWGREIGRAQRLPSTEFQVASVLIVMGLLFFVVIGVVFGAILVPIALAVLARRHPVPALAIAGLLLAGVVWWGLSPCGWSDVLLHRSGCLGVSGSNSLEPHITFNESDFPYADAHHTQPGIDQLPSWAQQQIRAATTSEWAVSSDHTILALTTTPKAAYYEGGWSPIKLFNVADGTLIRSLPLDNDKNPGPFAFTPDGQYLVSPVQPFTVWRVTTGETVPTKLDENVRGFPAFSPDGSVLVIARSSIDNIGHLIFVRTSDWSLLTAADHPIQAEQGSLGSIKRLAFSADGRRLASIQTGGVTTVWDVPTVK